MPCKPSFRLPLSPEEIRQKRADILSRLIRTDRGFASVPVTSVRQSTLNLMLQLYDEQFFNGFLLAHLPGMKVTVSNRLTSAAGKFILAGSPGGLIKSTEIRMSGDFLFRLTDGPFSLNGLTAENAQEAFLIVFEHELCHACETIVYGATGHSRRFKQFAGGLFGHTACTHSLPTRRQEAREEGLTVGMTAAFYHNGSVLRGVVSYIGKTATVMVRDPRGIYRDPYGNAYTKYRVPLSGLTKA